MSHSDCLLLDLIVCDVILLDQISQKWTLVGIVDQVISPQFPVGLTTLNTYARFANAPKKGVYGVQVVAPGGVVVASHQMPFTRPEGSQDGFAFGIGLFHVLFATPGRYEIACFMDNEPLGSRAFWAKQLSANG
jgi:hypothetical protein